MVRHVGQHMVQATRGKLASVWQLYMDGVPLWDRGTTAGQAPTAPRRAMRRGLAGCPLSYVLTCHNGRRLQHHAHEQDHVWVPHVLQSLLGV